MDIIDPWFLKLFLSIAVGLFIGVGVPLMVGRRITVSKKESKNYKAWLIIPISISLILYTTAGYSYRTGIFVLAIFLIGVYYWDIISESVAKSYQFRKESRKEES